MVFGKDAMRDATAASQDLNEAILQHADAVRHLAENLEEEVCAYSRELGARITMLHEAANCISSAGCEIAHAGERIARCGEHLAWGMHQALCIVAAGLLTVATALFGWRYLLLGCMCLWLTGFEVQRRPSGRTRTKHGQPQQQQGAVDGEQPLDRNPPAPQSGPRRVSFEQLSLENLRSAAPTGSVGGGVHERLPGGASEYPHVDGGSGSSASGGTMASRDLDIDGVFVLRGGSVQGQNRINRSLAAAEAVLAETPARTVTESAA